LKSLTDEERAAIQAYLAWRGWSEKAAARRTAEYEREIQTSKEGKTN
jgi:hypothetical protein